MNERVKSTLLRLPENSSIPVNMLFPEVSIDSWLSDKWSDSVVVMVSTSHNFNLAVRFNKTSGLNGSSLLD